MGWYTVSLLFKAMHIPPSKASPLWEEQVILIEADSEDQAEQEGARIGRRAEHEYEVRGEKSGQPPGKLRWAFDRVERVFHIDNERLDHGTELFSRFLRDSEVKSLLTPFDDEQSA